MGISAFIDLLRVVSINSNNPAFRHLSDDEMPSQAELEKLKDDIDAIHARVHQKPGAKFENEK